MLSDSSFVNNSKMLGELFYKEKCRYNSKKKSRQHNSGKEY